MGLPVSVRCHVHSYIK